MRVGGEPGVHLLEEGLLLRGNVSTSQRARELVTQTEHSAAGLLHQLADDGVAEEPHLDPLHPLRQILLLLRLEADVDEELL